MIDVTVVDARGRAIRAPGLARWLARVAPSRARGEVTIALVPDARIRQLNRRYRRKDYATDVLSFSTDLSAFIPARGQALPWPPIPGRRPPLGEIVIAQGVAARQAREHGHSLATELRILALHGLLHLLGYDHEVDSGQMGRLERRLRRKGGLSQGLTERARAREKARPPAARASGRREVRTGRSGPATLRPFDRLRVAPSMVEGRRAQGRPELRQRASASARASTGSARPELAEGRGWGPARTKKS